MARTILVSAVTALVVAAAFVLLAGPKEDAARESVDDVPDRAALLEMIEDLEARVAELSAPTATPAEAPAAAPTEAPAPAAPPAATQAAEAADAAKRVEVDRWIERLGAPDENTAFKAALQLAQLGDLRAVDALIETMREHRDFYVRLGAATALGDLKALDAVPALIDALDEKDQLVRTAASESLWSITSNRIDFKAGASAADRRAAQGKWRKWWRDNEAHLRSR
jgi:HEAT repeat protein